MDYGLGTCILARSDKVKHLNDGFVFLQTQLFTSQDINWWTGVLWITCRLIWFELSNWTLNYWEYNAHPMYNIVFFLLMFPEALHAVCVAGGRWLCFAHSGISRSRLRLCGSGQSHTPSAGESGRRHRGAALGSAHSLPLLRRLVPSCRWAGPTRRHRQLADPQPTDSSHQTPVAGRDGAESVRGGGVRVVESERTEAESTEESVWQRQRGSHRRDAVLHFRSESSCHTGRSAPDAL